MIDSVPYFIARISEDSDFFKLKEMAENHDGWTLEYDKTNVKVWTKHVADSSFNMVKVWAIFSDVNSVDLYDAIQDPDYRREWDSHMIVGIDIGYLNPNNDVCYYAMYCPAPLKNRDFVIQRSWLDTGSEFYILNHSVFHKDYPPKKGFIRAISYFTGYFIRCQNVAQGPNGCELSYVTRADPQGIIPSWLVNKCTQILAPRYMKQIEKAASRYSNWKSNNKPHLKPWVHPEQITVPRISVSDCVPSVEELILRPELKNFDFNGCYMQKQTQVQYNLSEKTCKGIDVGESSNEKTNDSNKGHGAVHLFTGSNTDIPKSTGTKKAKSRLDSLLSLTRLCTKRP